MYVCIYICMYICIYICIYIYKYTILHVYSINNSRTPSAQKAISWMLHLYINFEN